MGMSYKFLYKESPYIIVPAMSYYFLSIYLITILTFT